MNLRGPSDDSNNTPVLNTSTALHPTSPQRLPTWGVWDSLCWEGVKTTEIFNKIRKKIIKGPLKQQTDYLILKGVSTRYEVPDGQLKLTFMCRFSRQNICSVGYDNSEKDIVRTFFLNFHVRTCHLLNHDNEVWNYHMSALTFLHLELSCKKCT